MSFPRKNAPLIRNKEFLYWRNGQNKVDLIVYKDAAALAVEIKWSPKASGLKLFKRLFSKAKVLVLKKKSGELSLQQSPTETFGFSSCNGVGVRERKLGWPESTCS